MKYLFDNCISHRLPQMLRALEVDAVALRDECPESIADIDLFSRLKGQKVVFITTDTKQVTRLQEARALKESGVTALFFGPFFQRKRFWQQAAWLVQRWEKIQGFAEGVGPGTCAEIKQNGRANVYPL